MAAREVAAWAQSFREHGVPAVSADARALAFDLALYAAGGVAFPAINTLKRTHGLGYAKVRAALDELIAAGWFDVQIVTRGDNGGVRPVYRLSVPAHAQAENAAPFLRPAQAENAAPGTTVPGARPPWAGTVPGRSTPRDAKGSLREPERRRAPAASGAPAATCPIHYAPVNSRGICAGCAADAKADDPEARGRVVA